MKIIHYATRLPERGEKSLPTACRTRKPIKETTQNPDESTCYICYEKRINASK